ncbi:MAG: DUF3658 domain-containing protein [Streptococcaceae bacterium]|nr:DUF3658 domain-containing protein [Streptococcaceae bacterium]
MNCIHREYQIGVSDRWFGYRIEKMIEEGKLEVGEFLIKGEPNTYGKILCQF